MLDTFKFGFPRPYEGSFHPSRSTLKRFRRVSLLSTASEANLMSEMVQTFLFFPLFGLELDILDEESSFRTFGLCPKFLESLSFIKPYKK